VTDICRTGKFSVLHFAVRQIPIRHFPVCHFPVHHFPALQLRPSFSSPEWQDISDCCEGNKLHSIYPTVGTVKHSKNMSRYDSVLLNRLQIGHSRLTRSYLLYGDGPPACQCCGIPLTVKHILVECSNLRVIREKYFTVSSVTDLFKSIDNHTIINYGRPM